ncbi:uncharacterized protein LOC124789128 [Schistocerca piceifrons]|uniref:uncharacterized protein LOC124789128 n=1 Tax=Schistocerca piceifrons TaxID=274613 RepID=UPI001F5F69E3|nr:uncharacterized protein LOC124789128 [Schistocerca piceifrons]
MVDRFTRWPEATPVADVTAETVATAFVDTWVARFGCPSHVTTDRGRQFDCALFTHVARLCGTQLHRTTSYHPASNGMVERFHRTLKAALTCHDTSWPEALPLVLLGLRVTQKEEIGASPADLVYGQSLTIPGDFVEDASLPRDAVAPTLAERLRSHMAGLRAHAPTRHGTGKIFVHADLQRCTHVMLRTEAVRPPLRPPYSGPHRVIARGDKTLVLECNGKPSTVSVDRVKPAYVLPAPSATHFFDPAEDLFTDDTSSASGQTEPAPGAAGDAQLQPAVIAPPRAPPSTTPRQLVRPPGPRPPQAHRSPPPQPPADYVTRAGRRVRFKRPCCVASAPRHRNRQSRARAAERRQNSAPTSRRPL